MIARVVRSSMVEAVHDGAIAVVDIQGRQVASQGDVHRPYFSRSAAKPFQAAVAQANGAVLPPEWMAVACASHGGQPAHVAIVEAMLAESGLTVDALRCPPAWPLAASARHRAMAAGHPSPQRRWHNCSGKHAAMLQACVAQGWPTASYADRSHPLQSAIRDELAWAFGSAPEGPGVDGCGVPVWATSTVGLARAFARLASQEDYSGIWWAMHRFQALSSDAEFPTVGLGRWTETASKLGAEGVLGIAVRGRFGIAIKAWDGAARPLGAVAGAVLDHLGHIAAGTQDHLVRELSPPVLGGGAPVGRLEATVTLE